MARLSADQEWQAHLDALYHLRPELRSDPRGGWRQFQRLRWLSTELQGAEERSLPTTRWDAYLARRARETPRAGFAALWSSLGPTNISGRVMALSFDPTDPASVYAGSGGGGLWKSDDAGETWLPLGDLLPTLGVGAVAIVPRHPNTIILGTGDPTIAYDAIYGVGILRSTDGGFTWNPTNVVSNPDSIHGGYNAIEVNAVSGVVLAAGRDGLLRSSDDGATWTQVEPPANWTDVKWRPGSSDTAYAAKESGGLYLSVDGGQSFAHLSYGLPPDSEMGGLAKLAVSPSNPDYVYAGLSSAGTYSLLGIYRSTDGGATWSLRSTSPNFYDFQGYYDNTIAVDPSDPERIFVGGFLLYLSTDGGVTWEDQWSFAQGELPFFDHHAIAFRPGADHELWVGSDGGVFESADGGRTWRDRNQGLVTVQFYSVCAAESSRSIAYGGTQDHGTLRYLGGPSWGIGAGGDGGLCDCDWRDPGHVYGEWAFGDHFVSRDSLATLAAIINGGLYGRGRYIAPVDLDRSDAQRLFTATDAGIFRTTDGGNLWQRVGDGSSVVSISVSPAHPSWIWALERGSGKVRRSSDGGDSWTVFQVAPFVGIPGTKVLADPRDSLSAFCAYSEHPSHPPVLLRTTDGGLSWADVSGNLTGQSVYAIALDTAQLDDWYVGTGVGVWHSQDQGRTWTPYGTGLPYAVVLDLVIQAGSRTIRAATHGRGLWEAALPGTTPTPTRTDVPLLLERTSANPSNGRMGFRYAGRGFSPLRLSVFDLTGRLVARLADAAADGVIRTVSWDARGAASGVYFAVLQSASARVSRKVVAVR